MTRDEKPTVQESRELTAGLEFAASLERNPTLADLLRECRRHLLARLSDDTPRAADPYVSLPWRTVNGERVAVVPLWGERPAFIRDEDAVKWEWWEPWQSVASFPEALWGDCPAVIMRAREQNGEDV